MARAKKKPEPSSLTFEQFVKRSPELTVLTDHPLTADQIEETFADDPFNFRYKLGPVFDILRHPGTKTPAAILISGGWGTGKTSAMKWLECLLEKWNETGPAGRTKVRPVWFCPWKYDNKEDVRRCLIAEVIINATYVRDPQTKKLKVDTTKLKEGVKTLGLFAAKAAVDLASAVKIGLPGFGEVDGRVLKKIVKDFKEAAHPEKVYLQEYETALKVWVEKSLGKDERMVIFIDDLDRCMPEIGLQVLEALKLYLNISNLIFVVGVDKEVVEKLVVEHYRKLGLVKEKARDRKEEAEEEQARTRSERKARQYLSKMFQVEIELAPSQKQIADFFEQQIKDLTIWEEHLGKRDDRHQNHRDLFERLILKFARRNPRELKRQLNNTLMAGIGIKMIEVKRDDDEPTFEQGLQLYFIREILKGYTLITDMIDTDPGRRFFKDWSDLAIAYKDMPERDKYPEPAANPEADVEVEQSAQESSLSDKLAEKDSTYQSEQYLQLLNDLDLRALMEIPFSRKLAESASLTPLVITPEPAVAVAATGGVSAVVMPKRPVLKDYIIVRDAVARERNKSPDELTDDDYRKTTELNLSGSGITDISALKRFPDLQKLSLADTKVNDIGALAGLTNLQELVLSDTQIGDIRVLSGLTDLRILYLSRTQIGNVNVLSGLTSLQFLNLSGTRVSDIGALSGLTNLQELYLRDTQVSDVGCLASLTKLQRLGLSRTKVNDIGGLSRLTRLQWLDLTYTSVSDEQLNELKKALPDLVIGNA